MNIINAIEKYKVIGICRKIYDNELLQLATALQAGGLRLLEVTFDQQDSNCCTATAKAIGSLCDRFGDDLLVGAGTVLTREQVDVAKAAGARYIISPNTNPEVIRYTKEQGLVSIPGAMTPSEIITAHENGADFVKVFPTSMLGLGYLKDIMGPISHIKLIATGGINGDNLHQYLGMGIVGAGISGMLTDSTLLGTGDFNEFTRRAAMLMQVVNQN